MKTINVLRTLTLLTALCLGACSGETNKRGEQAMYQCPMECEGEKTYPEAGQCPVCGMDLVIKEQ